MQPCLHLKSQKKTLQSALSKHWR